MDASTPSGQTPLLVATREGHVNAVKLVKVYPLPPSPAPDTPDPRVSSSVFGLLQFSSPNSLVEHSCRGDPHPGPRFLVCTSPWGSRSSIGGGAIETISKTTSGLKFGRNIGTPTRKHNDFIFSMRGGLRVRGQKLDYFFKVVLTFPIHMVDYDVLF